MSYISSLFNIPLFLKSRNTYKAENGSKIQNYLKNLAFLYTKECKTENPPSFKLSKRINILPRNTTKGPCRFSKTCKFTSQNLIRKKQPAISTAQNEGIIPFESRRGDFGSYWAKETIKHQPKKKKSDKWKKKATIFDSVEVTLPKVKNRCQKNRGIFLQNARNRLPTSRSMVTDPTLCYRNPNEPGAAHYYPQNHEFSYNLAPVKKDSAPACFQFLRLTSVPSSRPEPKIDNISAFSNYETRFAKRNHTPKGTTYDPNLSWELEKQNRLRFRRKNFKKVKKTFYSPEWDHVRGGGYTRLFKNVPPKKKYAKADLYKKLISERNVQMFVDAHYIQMITKPKRYMPTTKWDNFWHRKKKPVFDKFNTLYSKFRKRQIRNNKKIGFLSSAERFENSKRPIFTVSQLHKIIKSLPEDRRLADHPISERNLSEIDGKLHEIPFRLLCHDKVKRRVEFKFSKVPTADDLLISDEFDDYLDENETEITFIRRFLMCEEKEKDVIATEIINKLQGRNDLMRDEYRHRSGSPAMDRRNSVSSSTANYKQSIDLNKISKQSFRKLNSISGTQHSKFVKKSAV